MATWIVTATQITNYELEVEADTYDEAIAEAERTSDYAFDELMEVGHEFTVDDAEEIE
jgi:hypothetical protein